MEDSSLGHGGVWLWRERINTGKKGEDGYQEA